MKIIWEERIDSCLEDSSLKLLACIYCEILESGKSDGDYSDWQQETMDNISAHLIGKTNTHLIDVLDAAVLEGRKLAV